MYTNNGSLFTPVWTKKTYSMMSELYVTKGGFQNQKPAKLGTLYQPLKPPSLPPKLGTLISKLFQNKRPNLVNFQTFLPLLGQLRLEASLT